MRPIRLSVKGFTCFRDHAELDFSGLDLFAITGPTGSGKSSLIDAMTFALYGTSTRTGKDKKDCIALGMPSAEVSFEFSIGSGATPERYRVARSLKRGPSQPIVKLERRDGDGWVPLASGNHAVNEQVARVVGLEFDGFTRAVVLPQNEFDRFLSGKADDRRKILDNLLNLGVYDRVRKRADDLQKEHALQATVLRTEIAQHYQDATAERLAELQREQADAASRVARLRDQVVALEAMVTTAAALTAARGRHVTATVTLIEERKRYDEAATLHRDGEGELDKLDAQLASVRSELAANPYDDGLFALLNGALPIAKDLARYHEEIERLSPEAKKARTAATEAAAQVADAQSTFDGAEEARALADRLAEEARREHAAADLRMHLRPGEPCPVCVQIVAEVPGQAAHPDLDLARERSEQARDAVDAMRQALTNAQIEATQKASRADSLDEQVKRCLAEQAAKADELDRLAGDAAPRDVSAITALLTAQSDARVSRRDLVAREEKLNQDRQVLSSRIDSARQNVAVLDARLQAVEDELSTAENEIDQATAELQKAAVELGGAASVPSSGGACPEPADGLWRAGWLELADAIAAGDPLPLVSARRDACRVEHERAISQAALLEADVERVKANVPVREEKEGQALDLEARAAIAQDLASLLKDKRFVMYVEDAALKILAQDGSARLEELSGGRYSFDVQDHEFLVSDHWNADATRPVSTLSGGETFLASLGLAEALAERMPDLAVGRGRSTLESLFIDEGFGTLDEDSLDAVAQALESLRAKNRMVCIITHVRPLAERMPARVEVAKSERGSALVSA